MMWKLYNGKLIHTKDDTRVRYKTRISKAMIDELNIMANEHNTHIGYLLESGFENILKEKDIFYDKKKRPKDRVEFRTTCDKEIIEKLRNFAKDNKLNLNDVIEASISYIQIDKVKNADHRYRIER
ncbi:LAGLIDADG DNA endonuclease family protein OS=Ureibacillus acetophenoni OX=614649 GN=SAMN05877842_103170 PE=4 SV=1 [Ureibacillus acetophenoni]